jgi:hypothetical protein
MNKLQSSYQSATGLLRNLAAMVYDTYALQKLAPLYRGYLPWTRASIRPRTIEICCNAITIMRPKLIVELGGGNSTFFFRALLRQLGSGQLLTVEDNETWAAILEERLAAEALGAQGSICYAPPRAHEWSGIKGEWYDVSAIDSALAKAGEPVAMLVVDGPPASHAGTTNRADLSRRVFALPHFCKHLADPRFVLLDDTNRPGEEAALRVWEQEFKVAFKRFGVSGAFSYYSNCPLLLE